MRNRHERKSKAKYSRHTQVSLKKFSSVPRHFISFLYFLVKNFRGKVHVDIFVEPLKNHALENHTMEIHVNC